MRKLAILIPDSFKGTMSSIEVSDIMANAIREVHPDWDIKKIPIADGGEGSIDAILSAVSGRKVYTEVVSPLVGQPIVSYFGLIDNDTTAIIEIAAAIGFAQKTLEITPMNASSFSVGQLVQKALTFPIKKILFCLGGSITNDGGCGIASCLGVRFYNRQNETFIPTGGNLAEIVDYDTIFINRKLKNLELVALSDVKNPLYGPNGAAYVFARQKGAREDMIAALDRGLMNLADVVAKKQETDYRDAKGSGAAGGIGFGLQTFFGCRLVSGIEYFLDLVGFDNELKLADYVFTGEGKLDEQSLMGKAISGIYARSKKAKVPMIAIVGTKAETVAFDFPVFETNVDKKPMSVVEITAKEDLRQAMKTAIREL